MRSSGGAGVRRPEGLNLTGNRKLPVRNEVEGLERDAKLGEVGEEVEMDKLRDCDIFRWEFHYFKVAADGVKITPGDCGCVA